MCVCVCTCMCVYVCMCTHVCVCVCCVYVCVCVCVMLCVYVSVQACLCVYTHMQSRVHSGFYQSLCDLCTLHVTWVLPPINNHYPMNYNAFLIRQIYSPPRFQWLKQLIKVFSSSFTKLKVSKNLISFYHDDLIAYLILTWLLIQVNSS